MPTARARSASGEVVTESATAPPAPGKFPWGWVTVLALSALSLPLLPYVFALPLIVAMAWQTSASCCVFEPSPDGRHEVVFETRGGVLDSYCRLWLTTRGERDRSQWLAIGPKVDGSWSAMWLQPNELLLTDYGAWPEDRQPYPVQTWKGVRIETRPRATGVWSEAPDQLHTVCVSTTVDSRGRRSYVFLQTTWKAGETCSTTLLPEGPWEVQVTWLTNDRLQLRIVPHANVAMPSVPESGCGIAIEVMKG